VEREVNVEVRVEGKVAEGYDVFAVTSNPARVTLRGPASHVNNIEKAPTESISLDGRKDSFDLSQVAINIPDQKVDLAASVVQVHVEIGERLAPRSP
jgi:YbbR domain-containing protein